MEAAAVKQPVSIHRSARLLRHCAERSRCCLTNEEGNTEIFGRGGELKEFSVGIAGSTQVLILKSKKKASRIEPKQPIKIDIFLTDYFNGIKEWNRLYRISQGSVRSSSIKSTAVKDLYGVSSRTALAYARSSRIDGTRLPCSNSVKDARARRASSTPG